MNYYNPENIKRGARFEMLSEITWKAKTTIQIYFSRNKMSVLNWDDIRTYLEKFNS